jgi:aminomethyltransferase
MMPLTGYEGLRGGSAWIDLTARGKIRVTGEDAGRLLHAMTTNNVKDLLPGVGLYAFFLNDKGRILADANIFRLGDEYWLDTEPETAAKIHHLLDKYIIADDAEVKDETAVWFEVGIEGPDSAPALQQLGLPTPENPLQIVATGWGYVARAACSGQLGFRIWAAESKRTELWEQLTASDIPQAFEDDVRVVRLEHGIPRYGEDITERYLVQETQALHGVHFNKGCYLGQEIVERVRSRGQVHRLLTSLRVEGAIAPPAGAKLVLAKPVLDESALGEITSSAYSPAFKEVVAFAYMRSEALEQRPEMLVAGTDPGVRAQIA